MCEYKGSKPLIYDEYRKKKNPRRPITEEKQNLDVFDHQIIQTLATDVIGVSFDAQRYEVFGYGDGESVGSVILELRGLGWSSTKNCVIIAAAAMPRGFPTSMYPRTSPYGHETFCVS